MNIPVLRDIFHIKEFPGDAKLMLLSSIIMSLSQGYMFVDYSIYLAQMGYNAYTIGILLSVPTFVGALLMIPIGSLSDRYGRKKFILISRLFLLFSFVILFFTYDFYLLILSGVLQGVAFSNASSSFSALLAEKTDSKNRNVIFASNSFLSGTFMGIGMIVGSIPPYLRAIMNISIFDAYRILFAISILLIFISAFIIYLVKEEYKGNEIYKIFPKKSKGVVIKLSVLGLIGLGAGVIVRLFSYWFYLKFHVDVNVLGPIFAISQFVTAFASMTTPEIASRLGEIKTIVLTESLSVIILITMPLLPNYYLAGVFLVLRNFLMNMSGPIMTSFTMSLIPPEERALGSAIIQFFDAVPRSFGPYIGGYFFSLGYIDLPFYFTGTLYTVSIILFYLLFKNAKKIY